MKIVVRHWLILSLFLAAFVGLENAYAVMFPQEVEQELEKEKTTQKTDHWRELERRHSEIQKTVSQLERQEKEYSDAFEKIKKEHSKEG